MEIPGFRNTTTEADCDERGYPVDWPSEAEIRHITIDRRGFWRRHPRTSLIAGLVAAAAVGIGGSWTVAEIQKAAHATEQLDEDGSRPMTPGHIDINPVLGDPTPEQQPTIRTEPRVL